MAKVILGGDGADELLAGYVTHRSDRFIWLTAIAQDVVLRWVYAAALPGQAKLDGLEQKVILKRCMSRRFPGAILSLPKKCFNFFGYCISASALDPPRKPDSSRAFFIWTQPVKT